MPISFRQLGSYGKLGNALFQIACAVSLAKSNNDTFQFPNTWSYKDSFSLPPGSFVPNISSHSEYSEPHFHYSPIPYRQNLNLLGYFQSEKYFKAHEKYIKQIYKTKYDVTKKEDTTSIHVRRTDYLNFPQHHPVLTMDYYHRAMERVGGHKFLVFSDDITWCKQNFIGNHFEFSEGNDAVLDLVIQSSCKNNIIANSSYSWWAAWLNTNEQKAVVAPKKWFGPALSSHNTEDLIPNGWIIL